MEVQGIRGHGSTLGAEKYEMLDLNKRLETYLGRVKFLEEENGQLREEVENLRKRRHSTAWKKELEGRLRKAREGVEAAWRERDRVELDVGNLSDELQTLELRRQREAAAKAEARKWLAESKKELEEEQRGQIWLREKLSQLEKELQFHKEVHREEVSALRVRVTQTPPNIVPAPVHHQVLSLQDLSQDYSQRAARAWREAATGYQDQVIQLEDALAQAKSHMVQATQDKKECQLKAQSLARELEVACGTKEVLEKRVAQQKEGHLMELKHLQEYLESLEGEKAALGHQISVILEDRCNLVQIKMSLGLEVATYRALLDSESLRRPTNPRSSCNVDERPDSQSAKQNHQTIFTRSHNISTVSTKHGARAQNQAATMAMMPLQASRQITPTETSRRSWSSKEQQFGWSVESSRPAGVSTSYPKGFGNRMGSIEYSEAKEALNEEITQDEAPSTLKSAAAVPLAINQLTRGGISRTESKEEQNMHAPEPESSLCLTSNDPTAVQEPIPEFNITGQTSELPSEIEKISCQNDTEPVDFPELNNPDALTTEGQQCPLKNGGENELDVPSEINAENVLLRSPLFAWGESQVVTDIDEIDHVERKASETKTEPGSGPEVDTDETDSFDCGTAASESELPLSVIKVNLLSEVLNHTERTEEKTNESVGSTVSTDDVDSSSIGIESEKLLENITVPGDDTTDIFNGKNGYEANQDSTEEIGVQTSDSETELSETEEEGKVIASKEKSDLDGETEKDVIFVNENVPILESSAEVKPRGEQQEQTSSDTEQLDSSDDDEKESSSWRTFGGEPESYDSYAQDNTLADTSPLTRYKSDEVDTQASYLDEIDSSENDDEGESVTGLWEQEKTSSLSSKGTATMEALIEKSQSETMKEEGMEKPGEEEEVEAGEVMKNSSLGNDETDGHERDMNCLGDETTDDGGPTVPKIYLEENSGDKTNGYMDVEEKGCSEACDFTAVLKEETIESESSLEPDARSHDNAGEETVQVNPVNTYRVWSSEVKPHTEQLDSSDDDEKDSPNASQSWRTFGGEPESYDSYAQDNTLADTSSLTRYKSDEVDTQASYLDEIDSSENDDEGESGTGLWEQEKTSSLSSKGTATMEALIEKSQSETMKEEGMEKPGKEEEVEAGEVMKNSSLGNDETDGHERDVNCLGDETTDDGGPTVPKIYLEENSGDKTNGYMDVEEKDCSESCDFTAVLKEETIESESSLEPDARSHDNAGEETVQVNPVNTYRVWSSEVKPHTEQLDSSDDDERDSPNASQSWRTFGGEPESYDSYAQDNTLADTSSLTRYKSDEVDTQASYLDEIDSSENDDEGESGTGLWEQEKMSSLSSKGTATMEALIEKSQSETMKEEGMEKPGKEEEVKAGEVMENSSLGNDETDGHERDMNCLGNETTDDGGPTVPEIYLEENSGDKTNGYMDVEEKGCSESCDFTAVLKEETIESESSLEPDARSHDNAGEETVQVNPANTYRVWSSEVKPHTEQLDSSDDDERDSLNVDMMDALTEESERETSKGEGRGEALKDEEMGASQVSENINLRNDETNTYRVCSDIRPHSEEEVKMDSDLENFTVSAASPSRVLAESYEVSSSANADKITCEMFLEQTVAPDNESEGPVQSEKTEIPADGNIEDEQNLSMFTNMDYTDDLSLQNEFSTGLLSQTNIGNFDDSFSSEDESPNASQFSQPLNQEGYFLENEDMTNTRKLFGTMGETKEHSSEAFSTPEENAIENVVGSSTEEDFSQQDQLEALENPKVEPQAQLFQNSQDLSELSQEISNSEDKKDEELVAEEQSIIASQPSEDFTNSTRNKADIFMVDETEELPQTNGKNMDLHNMFSSTLDDNFRNSAKATETGEDLPECELSNQTTMQPNQNLAYGVAWGDAQNLLGGNEYTMEAWKANKVPSQQEKGPMPVQIKKHLCRDMDEDKIHSEDSLEEGNSWSSGED